MVAGRHSKVETSMALLHTHPEQLLKVAAILQIALSRWRSAGVMAKRGFTRIYLQAIAT
jgi:hypothetical protein